MPRREAIVDVEHLEAAPRKRQRHDPVRVFGEDVKTTAVHVQHRRKRAGAVGRPVHVQPVLVRAVVDIGDVADDLAAVAVGTRLRVKPAGGGDAAKEVVDEGRPCATPKPTDHRSFIIVTRRKLALFDGRRDVDGLRQRIFDGRRDLLRRQILPVDVPLGEPRISPSHSLVYQAPIGFVGRARQKTRALSPMSASHRSRPMPSPCASASTANLVR